MGSHEYRRSTQQGGPGQTQHRQHRLNRQQWRPTPRALIIPLALVVAGLIIGMVWAPWGRDRSASEQTPTPTPDAFALEPGACIGTLDTGWEDELQQVPCSEPHTGVVLGTVPVASVLPDTETGPPAATSTPTAGTSQTQPTASAPLWPGDTALAERAMLACEHAEQWQRAVDDELTVVTRWPRQSEWDAGKRDYLCLARVPAVAVPTPTVAKPTADVPIRSVSASAGSAVERLHCPGDTPTTRRNARLKAASEP